MMKRLILAAWCLGCIAVSSADDTGKTATANQAGQPAGQSAVQRPARPRQAAPTPSAATAATTAAAADPADAPKFVSEAKWVLAGYNNNEIVYTIVVTNLDAQIIRCTTDMQGFYIEDGKTLSISDRQVTTIMPKEPTQVGNWMDMDEKSGATYVVKCKRV